MGKAPQKGRELKHGILDTRIEKGDRNLKDFG